MTRASWMHEAGHSKLVLWDNPEGRAGEGGGRGVQDEVHMYTHGWFMSMYGKNHHSIVKYLASSQNKLINLFKRRKLSDTVSGKMKKVNKFVVFFLKNSKGFPWWSSG